MDIKYFDHPHHLLSLSKPKYGTKDCPVCFKRLGSIGTQTYNCSADGCRYGVHESCAKLPQEVQSPFHPPHPLTLQRHRLYVDNYSFFRCGGCNKNWLGFAYRCDDCNFQFDRECAFMRQGKEQLDKKHPNHNHPLALFEKVPTERYKCVVCGKACSSDPDPTYGCWECRLFIHGPCFERKLPPEMHHFYHPHPLTLSATPAHLHITCEACYQEFAWVWYYSCKHCQDFGMDIGCTLLVLPTSTSIKSETQIQHFLHGHPLSLRNNQEVRPCRLCEKGCTGPTYVCDYGRDNNYRTCSKYLYFHKSCLELPQQICHPFHPYHLLTLLDLSHYSSRRYRKCNACRKHAFFIAYICESYNCDFILHVECSTVMMPPITYQGHSHLLQFGDLQKFRDVDKIVIEINLLECSTCKSNISESYAFTCLYCDFNLHLHCGPLPYTIKHKDHIIHPLFLTNSPLQEEVEDEIDEFYCHACEEERDPLLPVYYCAECQFVAEFKCVFSQVR